MPSIVNGLFSGRSGIQSHGIAISVLADNISNANTVGYKASRAEFSDLVAGNIGGGSGSQTVGSGSQVSNVTEIFSQGTFEFTGRGLDVAIDGNGFFNLDDNGARYYSRAGNLKIDQDGNVLNQNNLHVLGFPANGSGGLQPLNVREISQSDVETTLVEIGGNLDASSQVTAVPGTVSYTTLGNAASFLTTVDVFDTLGGAHTVNVYFFRTVASPSTWVANAYVDGGDITGGTAGTPFLLGSKTMTFDNAGSQTTATTTMTATPTGGWANGGAAQAFTIDFDPFTQFSASSNISSIGQDGKGSGNVVSFSVEQDGTMFALLDNGQTSSVGVLALTTFANPEGLKRVGNSIYTKTTTSGEPVVGQPGSGQFGLLEAGAIELSTSDIAADFIKLISLQRGFQSSSRVITAVDDLLTEIVNLAR